MDLTAQEVRSQYHCAPSAPVAAAIPVTCFAQIEIFAGRALEAAVHNRGPTRRTVTTIPIVLLYPRGHTQQSIDASMHRQIHNSPTSCQPPWPQLFSMYACRSWPFWVGAVRRHCESASSPDVDHFACTGELPGATLISRACVTPAVGKHSQHSSYPNIELFSRAYGPRPLICMCPLSIICGTSVEDEFAVGETGIAGSGFEGRRPPLVLACALIVLSENDRNGWCE